MILMHRNPSGKRGLVLPPCFRARVFQGCSSGHSTGECIRHGDSCAPPQTYGTRSQALHVFPRVWGWALPSRGLHFRPPPTISSPRARNRGPKGTCPPVTRAPTSHSHILGIPCPDSPGPNRGACADLFPGLWPGWTLSPVCASWGPRWDRD